MVEQKETFPETNYSWYDEAKNNTSLFEKMFGESDFSNKAQATARASKELGILGAKTAGNVGVDLLHLLKWAGWEVPKYFATDFNEDIERGVSWLSRDDVGIEGLKDWALGQIRAGHDMFMSDEIKAGTADKWIPEDKRPVVDPKQDKNGNWNIEILDYGAMPKWRLNDIVKQAEGYMNDLPGTSFEDAYLAAARNIGSAVSEGMMEALPEPLEKGLDEGAFWSDYFDTSENRFADVMAPKIPQKYVDTMGSMPGGVTPWLLSKVYNKMVADKPIHKGVQGTASLAAMQFALPRGGNAAFQIARNKAAKTRNKKWLYPEVTISRMFPHTSRWIGAHPSANRPIPIPGSSKIIKDGKISYQPSTLGNVAALTGAGIAAEAIRPENMPDFLSWTKPKDPPKPAFSRY
tara:strand:+ start:181 stop:1395 length:1215 start_codon:yes stop_codon:yes gene_type:complete